jgi:hypothetical protein
MEKELFFCLHLLRLHDARSDFFWTNFVIFFLKTKKKTKKLGFFFG